MHTRTFVRPLAGGVVGALLVAGAVGAMSFSAFAQQVPANCAPYVSAPAPTPSGWSPGPGSTSDNTFVGSIDTPAASSALPAGAAFLVNGWVVDITAQGWAGIDQVQIFSGAMGQGGTKLADALVAQSRPDVAQALGNPYYAASGFSATVNPSSLPVGLITLNVYAHSPSKGWWLRSETVTLSGTGAALNVNVGQASAVGANSGPVRISVGSPTSYSSFVRGSGLVVNGQARDPAAPSGTSGVSRVSVFLDNRDEGGQLLGDATPQPNGGFQINATLPASRSGSRVLWIYAVSSVTGRETVIQVPITVTDPNATPTSS